MPEKVAGPDDCLSRLERVQSAHLPQVLAAFLAYFRRVTGGTTLASLSTLRSGMKFLDPDGTVALQIVVKAHLSADLATVACISSHVRPAPLHELWPGAAIRVVAAPQVVYLSARLGFTLRDDTISYVMKP